MLRSINGQPPKLERRGAICAISAHYRLTFSDSAGKLGFYAAPVTEKLPDVAVQVSWRNLTVEDFHVLADTIEGIKVSDASSYLPLSELTSKQRIIDDAVVSLGRARPHRKQVALLPQSLVVSSQKATLQPRPTSLPAHLHSPVSPISQQPKKRVADAKRSSSSAEAIATAPLPESLLDSPPTLVGTRLSIDGVDGFYLRCSGDRCAPLIYARTLASPSHGGTELID